MAPADIPKPLRCLVGVSVAVWIASIFGEPSCISSVALGMVILGSCLIGVSCALLFTQKPAWLQLSFREATVAGISLGAFSAVVASAARIVFDLPRMDVPVSFASFTLGSVLSAVAQLALSEEEMPAVANIS